MNAERLSRYRRRRGDRLGGGWRGYVVGVLLTGAVLVLTLGLAPMLRQTTYLFAYAAVVVAAWYGGRGPALLVTVLSILGVEYFLVHPRNAFAPLGPDELLRFIVFGGVGLLVGSLHTGLRAAVAAQAAARESAERSAAHLTLVAEASELLASSLDIEQTLRNVARLAVPGFADWCAVDIVQHDELRRVAVEHTDPRKVQLAYDLERRYPSRREAEVGAWKVLRTGEPDVLLITDALLERVAQDEQHLRILRELELNAAVIAPLKARETVLGVITFIRSGDRAFAADEVRLALELARRGGVAIENARLLRETEDARTHLQEQAAELEAQTEELQQLTEELETATVNLQESNEALRAEKDVAEEARTVAEEANRAKSQFLATMSHELRTPLNAITGYAELIHLGVHGPTTDDQKSALVRIERNSKHLLGLINNILNFAKLQAGQVPLKLEAVQVAPLLSSMEPLIGPQLREKRLTFEHAECADDAAVHADHDRVEQILLNLLTNAVKFTPEGGRISTECSVDGGVVRIVVRDTGPGLPADKLEAIFEPFVQLDPRRTTSTEGVGLGLAISRDLARAMRGELRASSMPGGGAAFTLTLPRADRYSSA